MRPVLEHMYRIAILHDVVQYVFNKWYCTAEGREKDRLNQLLSKIAKEVTQYSYQENGRLITGGFLSDNDYKFFELAFGKMEKIFDPTALVN